MTPEDLELVAGTAERIGADPQRFGRRFYARLFELAPETRGLFPADIDEQAAKLVDELVFLTEAAKDLDRFLVEARALGARHAGYGVTSAHFGPVEDALTDALADALGPDWTDDLAAAWHSLYWLVAETMLQGSSEALFSAPPSG